MANVFDKGTFLLQPVSSRSPDLTLCDANVLNTGRTHHCVYNSISMDSRVALGISYFKKTLEVPMAKLSSETSISSTIQEIEAKRCWTLSGVLGRVYWFPGI